MLVKLSNELIRTSVVGLDAVLRTRLVTDVANALDAALWDGTGTSNTIKGILRPDRDRHRHPGSDRPRFA